jgi:uncharacterized membrane protein
MVMLVAGLVLFLSVHSVRIFADDWRSAQVQKHGMLRWKLIYAIISLAGLLLIINGYRMARLDPVWLWASPMWTRHLAALLTLPAFILLLAAYIPGSHIKAKVGHPMIAGVKLWALAHLIANGTLADVVLFGSFLVWAIVSFAASRRRDRRLGVVYPAGRGMADVQVIVFGLVSWVLFALFLHGPLIGVRPFG